MDAENTRNESANTDNSHSRSEKRQYQRYTSEQIQRLEAYFKECPNPYERQREELSRELGLDPEQIKFWFQNKKTQKKVHNERRENYTLRTEKKNLLMENLALREAMAMKSMMCMNCGSGNKEERMKALKIENAQLKEKIKNAAANLVCGQPENAKLD